MLSALLVALREGVEAALVVGIVLVYLNRTGRRQLARFVWAGVALAVACSFVAALLLLHWQISQDGFEGLLMLAASALVVSVVVWMNHIARRLRKEIEERIETYAQKGSLWAGLGVGLFVFLMVVREGAELVLILRAVEFSITGVQVWIGTGLGIALAVAVGLFFFQGTLKIPLGRFFAATSLILMVVAFQLALTGVHELSEALWIPSSKTEMSWIGPIVSNEFFFFAVILGVAGLVILREWFSLRHAAVESVANAAEKRLREWEHRRRRLWSFAAAFVFFLVILALAGEFVYAQVSAAAPVATPVVAQQGVVSIPLTALDKTNVRFYSVEVQNTVMRFLVVRKGKGQYAAALDACIICGRIGYRKQGDLLICRNCGAPINFASIGQPGGCNPIALESRVEGGKILVNLSALASANSKIH